MSLHSAQLSAAQQRNMIEDLRPINMLEIQRKNKRLDAAAYAAWLNAMSSVLEKYADFPEEHRVQILRANLNPVADWMLPSGVSKVEDVFSCLNERLAPPSYDDLYDRIYEVSQTGSIEAYIESLQKIESECILTGTAAYSELVNALLCEGLRGIADSSVRLDVSDKVPGFETPAHERFRIFIHALNQATKMNQIRNVGVNQNVRHKNGIARISATGTFDDLYDEIYNIRQNGSLKAYISHLEAIERECNKTDTDTYTRLVNPLIYKGIRGLADRNTRFQLSVGLPDYQTSVATRFEELIRRLRARSSMMTG